MELFVERLSAISSAPLIPCEDRPERQAEFFRNLDEFLFVVHAHTHDFGLLAR